MPFAQSNELGNGFSRWFARVYLKFSRFLPPSGDTLTLLDESQSLAALGTLEESVLGPA